MPNNRCSPFLAGQKGPKSFRKQMSRGQVNSVSFHLINPALKHCSENINIVNLFSKTTYSRKLALVCVVIEVFLKTFLLFYISFQIPPVNPVKKLRLRGDWSDTGPKARPRSEQGGEGKLLFIFFIFLKFYLLRLLPVPVCKRTQKEHSTDNDIFFFPVLYLHAREIKSHILLFLTEFCERVFTVDTCALFTKL